MAAHLTKVALVTGASRRIGAEIVKLLHKEGLNIVLHFNSSKTAANELSRKLNAKRSNSCLTIKADLTKITQITNLRKILLKHYGRIDLIVNNAAKFYKTSVTDITEKSWTDLIDINVKAPLFITKAFAKDLAKTQGNIINIIDIHAARPLTDYSVYSVSKAGLLMLTKSLAKELAPYVRVNAVSPSVCIWPEGKNVLNAKLKQQIINKTPLKRLGSPAEIAKAVKYLALDANFVTGEVLNVDGGRSL